MVLCGKQASAFFFLLSCSLKLLPPIPPPSPPPPNWKYHKPSNVTPSGSGEKQGRELASAGCCLCFSVCPELGDGGTKAQLIPV